MCWYGKTQCAQSLAVSMQFDNLTESAQFHLKSCPCHQLRFKDQIRLCSSAHPSKHHLKEFLALQQTIYRNLKKSRRINCISNPGKRMRTNPWRQMTLRWSHVSAGQWLRTYFSVLTLNLTDRPLSWATSWHTDYAELWTAETHSQSQMDSQTAQYFFKRIN